MAKASILAFFLLLEENLSVFHHQLWCLLWVFHIWLLLCWDSFFLFLVYWMFYVVKFFFCINWDDHVVFSFILFQWWSTSEKNWSVFYVKPSLHFRNKFHLIMGWSFSNAAGFGLLVFCWIFASVFIKIFICCFFPVVPLYRFSIKVMLAS